MPARDRLRLDKLVMFLKLAPSREIAQSLIMRGDLLVDDHPVTKCGALVKRSSQIRIRGGLPRFVSRGGDKLLGALKSLCIDVSGLVAIDVGASTGGFTDCLLQCGAAKVYCIDVGTAQLAEKLRKDSRVVVYEQLHAKYLAEVQFDPRPTLAVIDVSFISLTKIIPFVTSVLAERWVMIVLVKPQFELGPEYVGAGGVVSLQRDRLRAVEVVKRFAQGIGIRVGDVVPSVLKGAKSGNQEYFLQLSN